MAGLKLDDLLKDQASEPSEPSEPSSLVALCRRHWTDWTDTKEGPLPNALGVVISAGFPRRVLCRLSPTFESDLLNHSDAPQMSERHSGRVQSNEA